MDILKIAEEGGAIIRLGAVSCKPVSVSMGTETLKRFAARIRAEQKEKCAQTFLDNAKGCWTNAEMADAIRNSKE